MAAKISDLLGGLQNIIPNNNNTPVDLNSYINTNVNRFQDQPNIANQFKTLGSFGNGLLDDSRDNIINAYNVFEESTNPAFRNLIGTSLTEGNKMLADIDQQRQQAVSYYGPGGQAEQDINEYITRYGDLISQQAAGSQALAKSTGIRSGASEAAIRAGVSQQQALDTDKIIKFQEKKVGDLTSLYNTYNNLISGLRAEAGGVNKQFIIQPLAQALDRQQQIAQSLVNNEAQLNSIKLSSSGGSGSTNFIDTLIKDFGLDPDTMSYNDKLAFVNQNKDDLTSSADLINKSDVNTAGVISGVNVLTGS